MYGSTWSARVKGCRVDEACNSKRRRPLEHNLPTRFVRESIDQHNALPPRPKQRQAAGSSLSPGQATAARRYLGWTMTVLGIALMAGGAAAVIIGS